MNGKENTQLRKKHTLILESRTELSLEGVQDVAGFSDTKIQLSTEQGALTIAGSGLHIDSFSQETGALKMNGHVNSLIYSDTHREEGGFWAKLFK